MRSPKALITVGTLIAIMAVTGCASVPLDFPKTATSALSNTGDTPIARSSVTWRAADPGRNGFYPLVQGLDAFGARLVLMDRAERSIDAQYFLMKPDAAGLVFAGKLMQAADRGVRVRFLLDDIFTSVDDEALMILNEHPNIELRIFNPISRKGLPALNYVGNFKIANRRMHNKSFTVDNQVTVVGGRNIAEEYFQLDTTGEFVDFDMLGAGPVVKDISASFDIYWNHELAVPLEVLYGRRDVEKLAARRSKVEAAMQDSGETIYGKAIHTELMQEIFGGDVDPYFAEARTIFDDPQKLLEKVSPDHQIVATAIADVLSNAEEEIIIYTPYFIPGQAGMELIEKVRAKGVRVVLVTNSLASNNHTPVHSAYSRYRKRLLQAGVELYEARANAAQVISEDGSKELQQLTLHTKGIIIDGRYTFVGSLNLDPRSIDINTEMGVLIDSRDLGSLLAEDSGMRIANIAYRLKLDDRNRIRWHAIIDGQEVVETKEPLTSGWRRFQAWFLKIAPEKQL
ncbi:MAG: phospholipase D family protein [Gammaproteobacteria bacterium]|nr:phospholipase D family protein [Gammaproteobacteria bacterium]MDH4314106.1 phospholipase D family protein [Gammaproteobacteria bacterium]MDH5213148.1 phospholipase D family protein [Gammaproteobacteria bacterium]